MVYFIMGHGGQRLLATQRIDKITYQPRGERVLIVRTPVEVTAMTSGAGPYPLIAITPKRLFYSTFALRGNLCITRLD